MHRRSRWIGWVAVGAVVAVGVSGCTDEDTPIPSTTPTPTSGLTFSEADARDVYESFRGATDDMYAMSDPDYTLLLEWATDELATTEAAAVRDLADAGITSSGTTTIQEFGLDESPEGESDQITASVCEDISATLITAADGTDLTPADRDETVDLRVDFTARDGRLLVDAVSAWTGSGVAPCSG